MTIAGLLLAGGESRRMGGDDKGRLAWQGAPMASRVAAAMAAVVPALIVSANRHPAFYRSLGRWLVSDPPGLRWQGPLAGLLAGLECARQEGFAAVLVCPCDTPTVTPSLLAHVLAAYHEAPERPLMAEVDGRVHPLHGVVPVALADDLAEYLSAGERRVFRFFRQHGGRQVNCDAFAAQFTNRNTPDDLCQGASD